MARNVMNAIPRTAWTRSRSTTLLFVGGAIAGPVFVAVFLIEGATRAGYNPIRLPVSVLSVGADGWMQVVNFVVDGLLVLGFALGLARALRERGTPSALGPLFLAIFALAILGAGAFTTDPSAGFPPSTAPPVEPTTHAVIHDVVSVVGFTMLPLACLVFARRFWTWRDPRWAAYSAITGAVLAVGFLVLIIGFNARTPFTGVTG